MKKIVVSHKILALLGEEESREIEIANDEIFRTEDRHYLHILFGRINKFLMPYATKYPISNKEIQEFVSDRKVQPLIALGLIEYVVTPFKMIDIKLVADEFGNLIGVDIKGERQEVFYEKGTINTDMKVQDFIYSCIGKFYSKKGA